MIGNTNSKRTIQTHLGDPKYWISIMVHGIRVNIWALRKQLAHGTVWMQIAISNQKQKYTQLWNPKALTKQRFLNHPYPWRLSWKLWTSAALPFFLFFLHHSNSLASMPRGTDKCHKITLESQTQMKSYISQQLSLVNWKSITPMIFLLQWHITCTLQSSRLTASFITGQLP